MNKNALIHQMGVIGIDHIAVTTDNFIETLYEYLAIPGARLLKGPARNEQQKVNYAFTKMSEGTIVEVLGALTEDSPIMDHVKRGGGVYHFCYIVQDINWAVEAIKNNKGRIIVDPIPSIAFDERRIAFAFHHYLGLFELVAMLPDMLSVPEKGRTFKQIRFENVPFDRETKIINDSTLKNNRQIEDRLIDLMQKELNIDNPSMIKQASLGSISNWDSLGHLKLAAAIETEFDILIDSGDLYSLRSFKDILSFLQNKIHAS